MPTLEDLRAAFRHFARENGSEAVTQLLVKFGAGPADLGLSDVPSFPPCGSFRSAQRQLRRARPISTRPLNKWRGVMSNRTRPNFDVASRFADLIAGESDSLMCWQVFDDKGKNPDRAEHRHGRLSDPEIRKWLEHKNRQGCGVYVVVSETDGKGRRRENIKHARAAWIDLDGEPLPGSWPIKPHIICELSNGRFHCFWLIDPTSDLNAASDTQAQLAAYYNGDPIVIDPSRVCRVPGFDHHKREPFRSRIIELIDPVDAWAARLPLEEVAEVHPCDYKAPSRRTDEGRSEEPEHGWDNAIDVSRARAFLKDAPPSIEGQGGNKNAFWIACELNDFGISKELSLELMLEDWDSRCEPPWELEELETIIRNAARYKAGPAGADSGAGDFADALGPEPIQYDETKLPEMLDHVESAMLAGGVPLYQMGGRIVHPVRLDRDASDDEDIRRKAGALTIGGVSSLRLREYMIERAPFYRLANSPKIAKSVRTNYAVPLKVANHYLARGDKWCVSVLRGVIEAPTLRSDGTLLVADGYDEASGLLLDTNGVAYPAIKEKPTRDDGREALQTLLWPFTGFPFVKNAKGESASRSVMLSAVLTSLVRRTLHSAPLHGFSAPTMGTGKTLACDVVSMIASGRLATAMSQGASEEEDEKRLFSVLLTGDLLLLIDNVKRPIEGDALCTILTQATWQSRILGENRKVSVPTNALFLASGNNLTFKGDMTTRALLCRLDAKVERPETRRFDIDLKAEVPKRRPKLVAAGLTILRAFVVAGRPGLDRLESFGRFEDWSNLVRGALVWLGEPDPCRTRAYIAVDDPERTDLEQLLKAIEDNTDSWFTAGELLELAMEASDDMLADAIDGAVPKATTKALGLYLKAKSGRMLGGLTLRGKYNKDQKIWRYRVV